MAALARLLAGAQEGGVLMVGDERRITPGVGVWPSVDWETYAAWDCASHTRLSYLANGGTPAHLWAHLQGMVDRDTTDKAFGRALHCAVLEPDRFHESYITAEPCVAVLSSGKRKGEQCSASARTLAVDGRWLCGQHDKGVQAAGDGRVVLGHEDYAKCIAMRDRLLAHPEMRKLAMVAREPTELSIVWPCDGVLCKARLDKLVLRAGVLLDVKKARNASKGAFARAVGEYGYYRQNALYMDGCNFHWPGRVKRFVFAAIEDEPPYEPHLIELDKQAVEAGRYELAGLLAKYRACMESGEWPGYGYEISTISLAQHVAERIYAFGTPELVEEAR